MSSELDNQHDCPILLSTPLDPTFSIQSGCQFKRRKNSALGTIKKALNFVTKFHLWQFRCFFNPRMTIRCTRFLHWIELVQLTMMKYVRKRTKTSITKPCLVMQDIQWSENDIKQRNALLSPDLNHLLMKVGCLLG